MSRYSKNPCLYEKWNEVARLAGGFCGKSGLWFGLVFYYIHTSFWRACMGSMRQTRLWCAIFSLPLLLKIPLWPVAKWSIRKERTPADLRIWPTKRTMGIQKQKKRFKLPVLSCPARLQVIRSGIDLICRLRGGICSIQMPLSQDVYVRCYQLIHGLDIDGRGLLESLNLLCLSAYVRSTSRGYG
jgi:hypothetical protein